MDQPRTQEGNQTTAKDGFGVHLRREREMRGVTLEEISSATRIGTRFLDALETEQWDVLPGGVFNRGFVRSTAQFLGLDPEAMLAEYTLATTDATRAAAPVMIHSQSSWTPRAPESERRWLPVVVLIAIVAVGAGGFFGLKHYRGVRRARAADAALSAASPDASNTSAPAVPATQDAEPAASQPGTDSSPLPDATSSAATPPAPTGANDGAPNSADASGSTAAPPAAASPDAASTPPASAAASASAPLILKIEAGRATSVKVSIDGHKTFSGKIPAGGSKIFHANDVFYVTARDAGGVLLELNGQTLPPLGPQGRSGSIRLTRETLKSQDGTSH
jgi:cytoskeleton protein RodZ